MLKPVKKHKSAMTDWHLTSKLQLDMGPDDDKASVKTVDSTPDCEDRHPIETLMIPAAMI